MDSQAGPPPDAPNPEEQRLPVNQNPQFLVKGFFDGLDLLQDYGWVLLGLSLVLLYIIYRLRPYIERARQNRDDQDYYKKFDEGTVLKRQEAMEAARRRIQQEHDQKAAEFAAIQKEREEKKRQEKIEDWERHQEGRGYRSKVKSQEPEASTSAAKPAAKPKKPLRDPDYNPLTGSSGGSACYRPTPRGGARGGG